MVSLKISISIRQFTELRTKIKLESDCPENALPFENLLIEALPSEAEGTDLRLHFINGSHRFDPKSEILIPSKKSWWKKFFQCLIPNGY